MRELLRAGIVGAGLMGHWHARELMRAGGKLVAVVDVNEAGGQRLAQNYRAPSFRSLDELFSRVNIDVLHICTPLGTHSELAQRGLESGAHLLIEKPFAPDADTTMNLLEQARSRKRLIMPVHQFIFQRCLHKAMVWLPKIAPLVHLDFTIATAGATESGHADQLIADILPHPLGLLDRILPGGLDGIEWQITHPVPGEMRVLGTRAVMAGGAKQSPSRNSEMALPQRPPRAMTIAMTLSARGRPTRNSFMMMGERGSVYADLFHGFAVLEPGNVSRTRKMLQPFTSSARMFITAATNLAERAARNEPAYPGLRELIRSFYNAIQRGVSAPITPQEIIAVACARDRLIAQANLEMTE